MRNQYEDRIDLRQLRYFVAVAEELHFGRAAERLGMAQPPLTQQIQKLERALGCRVFLRQPRNTSLTEAGVVLLDEARRLLDHLGAAVERTRRAGRGEMGHLTVGVPPSVMLSALPSVIRTFRKRFPEVSFTLRELSTSAIADGLAMGTLDVGFLRETEASGSLAANFAYREALVAVLPVSHALAARPRLRLGHLAAEPFVLFPRRLGEAFYNKLNSLCVEAGFTPRVVQEATQWQSVVTFVETGMGVSLAPACVTKFRWNAVVYRPLPGLSTTVTACCQNGGKSAAAETFLRLARAKMG
ncbi:MAG TPA: LysR substrate-binding domain-containing protein [Bryobacteraceae bacterium]